MARRITLWVLRVIAGLVVLVLLIWGVISAVSWVGAQSRRQVAVATPVVPPTPMVTPTWPPQLVALSTQVAELRQPTATAIPVPTATPVVVPTVKEFVTVENAVKLTPGQSVIPPWGYGPWGQPGVVYPKVAPGGKIPGAGPWQLVTDFNGRNWKASGEWHYTLPSDAGEVWVIVQGDAPGEAEWKGDLLILRSNKAITERAPVSVDNAPKPEEGSSGISLVVFVR